jgi:hypothetical protein
MLIFTLPAPAVWAIAATVPMIMGFIWYNPKVFGKAWMASCGLTPESAQKGFNMPLVFGLSYLLSFMLAFSLSFVVIHQYGFFSMMMSPDDVAALKDHSSPLYGHVKAVFDAFGTSFHTFKHGALHASLLGVFTILPIIATGAMFERKGFKYIAINAGYWIVCLAVMGAIVCHFMPIKPLNCFI